MECDICHRNYDRKRLPFLCAVDARNQAYDGRIKNLQLLIQNEELQKEINDLLEDTAAPSKDQQDALIAQQRIAEDKTSQILAAADKLRADIQAAKDEIRAKKAALARRKSDLASVSNDLLERRAKQQADLEKSIQLAKYRSSQSAEDMARTRSFLCMEAARLYGLKRVRKGPSGRHEYHIGRIPVVDLTGMNSISPEIISTSLSHVAHMLMLAAHYLAVRLPAAITLPHRDYPRPTILNLSNSYRLAGDGPFQTQGSLSTPMSENQGADSLHIPRPRPLFIDKPLPQLSKEDPASYSFFLEGVTLLAYDIAWLCSSQGVSIGDRSAFEDVCNMGRNLHNLLISQQSSVGNALPINKSVPELEGKNGQCHWIGRYSHGTTYYSLGGAEGAEFTRSFKLPGPMKLADKLKKKLISDAPAPDWEVLDDDAWKIEDGNDGGVLRENQVKGGSDKSRTSQAKSTSRTGSSGWMKVKNR